MGEEYDILDAKFIVGERTLEFSQVESVEIVSDTEESTNEVFASIKPTAEMEFSCSWTMSKKAYFMLMVGTNRRMIRRAQETTRNRNSVSFTDTLLVSIR